MPVRSMANPMKTTKSAFLCALLGAFLYPAGIVFAQPSPPTASSRLAALSKAVQAKPADPAGQDEWSNAQLYLRKAKFLLSAYAPSEGRDAEVSRELGNAEEALSRVQMGRLAPRIGGLREEGYYSDNDASFQPFLRYLPAGTGSGKKLPLLVFLHGYNPAWNLVNWQIFPTNLVTFAEEAGFAVAAPFGRGNTDYQGIGEQDVLAVIGEMRKRYAVDEDRIVLAGYSMGGLGAWTLGAHDPDRFAGLLIISGRGDYYTWHKVNRAEVPVYRQRLVDADFAGSLVPNLRALPILCAHGAKDELVPVDEARFMVEAVKKVNPGLVYIELPEGGHAIWDEVMGSPKVQEWLRQCRRKPDRDSRLSGTNTSPRAWGSVRDAFLSPFVFILAGKPEVASHGRLFKQAVADWYQYSKALPRVAPESGIKPEMLAAFNLFLFGEPENSALIRKALADSPVTVTAEAFVVGKKSFPRKGNGLYLARKSPWNPAKQVVVQCGALWGEALPENHKYDGLPGFIVYADTSDKDGFNAALAAGFFDEQGQIAE